MNKIQIPLVFIFVFMFSLAHSPQAQELKFNADGDFKIVQFTDLHYKAGLEPSLKTTRMMENTLDAEKPDLVVFTGDVVVSAPTAQGWDEVLALVISRKIPYVVVLGNHDDESEWTRTQVADYVSKKPFLVNKQPSIAHVDGVLNASMPVIGSDGKPAFTLYAMDSKAYSSLERVKGYDWFAHNQVQWYVQESERIKSEQGQVPPALAFFHIPLPEYAIAFNNQSNKRLGVRYEKESSPAINSGMFAAMLLQGDVIGTFVGHDHVNDYMVDYYGIALTFGCFSGSENTYIRQKNGARIVKIKEGVRGFRTYIREFDGDILYSTSYPFL